MNRIILVLGHGLEIVLYLYCFTSSCWNWSRFLLSGDHYPLVCLVTYTECWTSASEIVITIEVWTRCWVFFHVPLHPVWKLFFPAKTKACSFSCVFLEAAIKAIRGLSWVFGSNIKAICFGDTIGEDGFLEGGSTLSIEDALIE